MLRVWLQDIWTRRVGKTSINRIYFCTVMSMTKLDYTPALIAFVVEKHCKIDTDTYYTTTITIVAQK